MSQVCMNDISFEDGLFSRLSPNHCEKLHNASLEILARTGVRLDEQEAVEFLKKLAPLDLIAIEYAFQPER